MSGLKLRPDVMVALAENIVDPTHPIRLTMSEEGIAYAQRIHELVHRHGLDPDTIVLVCDAAGGSEEALFLLDEGFPIEYIIAMGGTQ